jgi:hypothetical protein
MQARRAIGKRVQQLFLTIKAQKAESKEALKSLDLTNTPFQM